MPGFSCLPHPEGCLHRGMFPFALTVPQKQRDKESGGGLLGSDSHPVVYVYITVTILHLPFKYGSWGDAP